MIELREKLKQLYARYEIYFLSVIKFVLSLFIFICINQMLGYMEFLNSTTVIIVLAVISAILPWNGIAVLGVVMVILHCFGLGIEVGAAAIVLYLLLAIFYFRFVPEDGMAITLMAACCSLNLSGIVLIGLGLMRRPVSALSAVCSMISWYFIRIVTSVAAPMKAAGDSSSLEVLRAMVSALMDNQSLMIDLIVCAAVVVLVSLIADAGFSYGWQSAIFVGACVQLGLSYVLSMLFQMQPDLLTLLTGTAIAVVVSFVMAFFVYNVDYKGAEILRFEDDRYFYYVKAIPKKMPERNNGWDDDDDDDYYFDADFPEQDADDADVSEVKAEDSPSVYPEPVSRQETVRQETVQQETVQQPSGIPYEETETVVSQSVSVGTKKKEQVKSAGLRQVEANIRKYREQANRRSEESDKESKPASEEKQ